MTNTNVDDNIEILQCHLIEIDERISYLVGEIRELETYKEKTKLKIQELEDMVDD